MPYDRQYKVLSVSFNPANIVKATAVEQTVTVAGLAVGDVVIVNKPTLSANAGIVGARVTATDTLGITFMNCSGAGGADVNPGAETYLIGVLRP